ncbi:MAG: class I SAM-dependent methyltransferase [Verrucomicrobiota bacterium]
MEELRLVAPDPLWHPSSVAARAALFGIDAPDIKTSSILESDCADGGNILSVAASLPNAQCTGISRSAEARANGLDLIAASGLVNVCLLDGETELDDRFDYIFLRNTYSRYSENERNEMMKRCASLLKDGGFLVVESLCLPGWSYAEPIRAQLQYHTRNIEDPHEKMIAGRQFLAALVESVPSHLSQLKELADSAFQGSTNVPDINFGLEYFDDGFKATYFHEFITSLDGSGLQYLCDLSLGSMMVNQFPAAMSKILPEDAGIVESEQYLDFTVNRAKRFSILCSDTIDIDRSISPDAVRKLYFSTSGLPDNPDSVFDTEEVQLNSPNGGLLTLRHASAKAALLALASSFPKRLSFDEVCKAVENGLGSFDDESEKIIAETLVACAVSEIIQVDSYQGGASFEGVDKPKVSALARAQAESDKFGYVSSLQHRSIVVDSTASQLLSMLDGSVGVDELVGRVGELISQGDLIVKQAGEPIDDEAIISEASEAQVRAFLDRFLVQGVFQS